MEILDLYRDEFIKTGDTVIRGGAVPAGCSVRIVFACIFNTRGQMLIQQRCSLKRWGGYWDVSAGGAVKSGENSLQAAVRETGEELGLKVSGEELDKRMSLYYEQYIHDIFTAVKDFELNDLVLQTSEVSAVKWASEADILNMIDNGEFLPVEKSFISILFSMREREGVMR